MKERDLTSEFRAMEARAAQALPPDVLGAGLLLAQRASEFPSPGGHRHFLLRRIPSPLPLSLGEGFAPRVLGAPASRIAFFGAAAGLEIRPRPPNETGAASLGVF